MGAIAEGLADLPQEIKQNLSIVLLDTMGIYWTMKYPNFQDAPLAKEWGFEPKGLDVKIYTPTGFFYRYKEEGIPTDLVEAKPHSNVMTVTPAKLLGVKNQAKKFKGSDGIYGLECVFRKEVFGSWWRRYPCQVPGSKLDVVEFYAKGKAGEPDILMVDDAMVQLGMMNKKEMETTKKRTEQIGDIMYSEFAKRNFHLVDGKMEWGRDLKTGDVILIDDLSPDTFRVCQGFDLDKKGNCKVNERCIKTDYRQKSEFLRCSNPGCFESVEVKGKFERFIEAKNILSADPTGLKKLAEAFRLEI